MNSIEIINNSDWQVNLRILKKEISGLARAVFRNKSFNIVLALISEAAILKLNKQYVKKNSSTDILTFDYCTKNVFAGDIAICVDVIEKYALYDMDSFPVYVAETILHGLLHLTGMTHDYKKETLTKLSKKQKFLLKKNNININAFNFKKKNEN